MAQLVSNLPNTDTLQTSSRCAGCVKIALFAVSAESMASTADFISQEAELVAVKDGKQYIISQEKEAQIEGPGEKKGDDLATYILQHANVIRDYTTFNYDNCTAKATKD